MKLPSGRTIYNILQMLPAISFAIMLGAALVFTAFSIWYTCLIAYRPWPADQAANQIHALFWGMVMSLGSIIFVVFVLAFGRIDKLRISSPTGFGGEIEFEDDDDHNHQPNQDQPNQDQPNQA